MAPVTPPAWQQAGSYSARLDRLTIGGMMTPAPDKGIIATRSGVRPSPADYDLGVTQRATPDRWVTVKGGVCFIQATSTIGGIYECVNDAPYDVVTAAAHASLARKDLIVARVYDAIDDVGSTNEFKIEVITGTPASSPARPTTPSQALGLAEVLIPAASTTVVDANITDLRVRTVGLGGLLPVSAEGGMPPLPYTGQAVHRSDTNRFLVWDGTAWQGIAYGAWTSYTPAVQASSSNPGLGSGSVREGAWVQIGKTVHCRANIQMGTSGVTAGSGTYRVTLPVAARTLSTGYHHGVGTVLDNSASDLIDVQVRVGTGTSGWQAAEFLVNGSLWSNTTPFGLANGDELGFSLTYEAA